MYKSDIKRIEPNPFTELNLGKYSFLYHDRLIQYDRSTFPDGTIYFKLKDTPSQKVRIWCRLNSFDDVFELMFAVDALRRNDVQEIEAVIPYIPCAQQDRPFPQQPFSLKIIANILNGLKLSKISCVDAHSSMCEALIDNLVDVTNQEFIRDVLKVLRDEKELPTSLNFISPDAGAGKKICSTLSFIEDPEILVCQKERDTKTNKLTKTVVPQLTNERPCLIIDDIVLAGGSAKNIVQKFREQGAKNKFYLACTHAIFPNGAIDSLKEYFECIFVSDSRGTDYSQYSDFIRVIPLFGV